MSIQRALPKICVALGLPDVSKLLEHAKREAEAGETFLEFRLDYLAEPERGAAAIAGFLKRFPECVILATCRRHQNHGRFNGSIERQLQILDLAVENGAGAVDVEIESAEAVPEKLALLRGRSRLVVSYHHYESTPPLEPLLKRMQRAPADVYKIVTTPRKPSDCGRLLDLLRARPRPPLVVLAMGEAGFPTRVLSPILGSAFTYAAPSAAEGTATGQVSARPLRQTYRMDRFSKSAKVYGVIASPVRHSVSPAVQNRAFQARRIEAVYLPFLVQPAQLKDFFVFAEKLPVSGFSVTIPHKQKALRYLDAVDGLARRIGAVNTVWRRSGRWRGTNTDAPAVIAALSSHVTVPRSSVLIAGNGGAARAAACALAEAGAKLSLVGRNRDRVRMLARVCGAEPLGRDQLAGRRFDVLVHATPLGMYPHVNESFFPGEIPADVIFDMVYNPIETALIRNARQQSKKVVTGMEMFLEQAARQFEIWTGETPPRQLMQRAAIEALENAREVSPGSHDSPAAPAHARSAANR